MKKITLLIASLFLICFSSILRSQEVVSNLFGGEILSMAVSGNNIFVGTYSGIFLSTNYGIQWKPVNNGLTVYQYEFLKAINNKIYAGSAYGNLFVTSDNGSNWTEINKKGFPANNSITSIVINGKEMFVGLCYNSGGIFYSPDNGATWTTKNKNLPNLNVEDLVISGNKLIEATYDGGVFISTDNGENWTESNNGLTSLYCYKIRIKDSKFYLETSEGVFISADSGASWKPFFINNTTNKLSICIIDESNFDFYNPTFDTLFISPDHGKTWKNVLFNGVDNDYRYAFTVSGNNFFLATLHGFYISTDNGDTWIDRNNGLTNVYVGLITVIGNTIYIADRSRLFKSTDGGKNWKKIFTSRVVVFIRTVLVYDNRIFISTLNNGILLTTDDGNTWTQKNNGFLNHSIYKLLKSGNDLYAGTGGNGLYISKNEGELWEKISNNGIDSSFIYTIAEHLNYMFVGTADGGIFRSSDRGLTFEPKNSGYTSKYCRNFYFIDNYIFALSFESKGVFRSSDNGDSWVELKNGLNLGLRVTSLVFIDGIIYAGVLDGGLFKSTDFGDTWVYIDAGIQFNDITTMDLYYKTLIIGTWGESDYDAPVGTDVKDDGSQVLNVSPNPANEYIRITSELLTSEKSRITITNYFGEIITNYSYNKIYENIAEINSKNMTSGIYFLTICNGNSFLTKKFNIVR